LEVYYLLVAGEQRGLSVALVVTNRVREAQIDMCKEAFAARKPFSQ